ncbi:translation initiation factor 3, subunit D [Guillardia theta CCMP2712]|uniref:Translation initiation factor 3, subunit D n=1 Tax=Guillardia theta (strain CCMP2712) TaxID=905079 RepID=L1JZ46_GUITC|nr:translation initiation factor 3, subunit D [Guillardia theta CCMP2712]EKX53599.1 translation initiation factor 3, subunit D [Guillardia theta CCMP2712]|eukprot:XP_005840579.1 translation initiation factor 3, subunit D [Guillardia theta CCMP2712]
MASFALPQVKWEGMRRQWRINDNASGWGPTIDSCPEKLKYLPYAPFSKNDRLGRACEWIFTRDRESNWKHWTRNKGGAETEASPFVIEQVDDEGFHLVDTKTTAKPKWGPGSRRPGMTNQRGGLRGQGPQWSDRGRDGQSQQQKHPAQKDPRSRYGARGARMQNRGFDSWRDKPQRIRVSSVEVKPEWTALDGEKGNEDFTMSLPQMEKLKADEDPRAEELAFVGTLYNMSKAIDKASVRTAIQLKKMQEPKPFHLASIDDPVIKKLASQGKAQIFTTDIALAVLMSAPRSVISWDMVVQRAGSSIFLDIREGSSVYDTTVNETAQDAPDDDLKDQNMNSMTALATEAGYINYCYSQQNLDKSESPAQMSKGDATLRESWSQRGQDPQLPPGKAFRYRKFELDDDMTLVVRCEVDAVMQTKDGSNALLTVKALNEFDPKTSGIDWRQKLESQRAAVLANELKNNRNKLARWTCQALLAGVDYIKIGYVSRAHSKDNTTHFVLHNQLYRPEEFAKQIDLKIENIWGIATTVMKRLMQLPVDESPICKYLMLKDPNRPTVNLYKVPADAFDYEVEDDDNDAVQGSDDDSDME